MVPDHWSNDAMVSMDRCGLMQCNPNKVIDVDWIATGESKIHIKPLCVDLQLKSSP